MIDRLHGELKTLRDTKGKEYRNTDEDEVLMNFKRGGERIGDEAITVLSIFMLKHIDSICDFIKTTKTKGIVSANKLSSEPIEGRIKDLINYLYLLNGLITEMSDNDTALPCPAIKDSKNWVTINKDSKNIRLTPIN